MAGLLARVLLAELNGFQSLHLTSLQLPNKHAQGSLLFTRILYLVLLAGIWNFSVGSV